MPSPFSQIMGHNGEIYISEGSVWVKGEQSFKEN